jgi:hypothetical protein
MKNRMQNPDYWRERAEETRTQADRLWIDENQKQRLLRVAEEYDQLAQRAEQWKYGDEAPARKTSNQPNKTTVPG